MRQFILLVAAMAVALAVATPPVKVIVTPETSAVE